MKIFRYNTDKRIAKCWLQTEAESALDVVSKYYHKECFVWDADVCGDGKIFFAVKAVDSDEIEYFELNYDWYIETEPEWEVVNGWDIVKVNKDACPPITGDRDWMKV